MSYLLDTNVISELRKGARADANVRAWFRDVDPSELYLSVLVIGEIRRGIESIRRRDPDSARALDGWFARVVHDHADRVLAVSFDVAVAWGSFGGPDRLPVIDALMAATALVHRLTLVTRNVADVARTGVDVLDPFAPAGLHRPPRRPRRKG